MRGCWRDVSGVRECVVYGGVPLALRCGKTPKEYRHLAPNLGWGLGVLRKRTSAEGA